MTHRFLSLLLLTACSAGSTGPSNDGGVTSDATSDASPIAAEDFCDALVAIVCDANERCCDGVLEASDPEGDPATCEAPQRAACRATVEELVDDPRTAYVPERAGAYLAALETRAAGCFAEPPQLAELYEVFAGTGVEGADCTPPSFDEDGLRVAQLSCGDGLSCHLEHRADGSDRGVCEPRIEGECSHALDCGAGRWCNLPSDWVPGLWGTCQPLKANGWDCSNDQQCASLYCGVNRVCATPPPGRYCVATSYETAVRASLPEAFFRFDEAGARTVIDSVGDYTGTYEGASFDEGAIATETGASLAITAMGTGAILDPDGNLGLELGRNALSYELWFRRSAESATGPLLEFGTGEEGQLGVRIWNHDTADKLHFNLRDEAGENHATTSAEGLVTADTWHHVVATYDGSNGRLYLDGEPIGEAIAGSFVPKMDGGLYVGFREGDERHITGAIDEVAIYERVLSRAEIRQHRAIGANGPARREFPIFAWLR
ncbi:MAG: hypothetical protein H6724_14465 [Sandaracinus sp.]|nr:hypothetical protein [Sandaracinus sp.]